MDRTDLRKRVLAMCRRGGTSFDNAEVDYAIQAALYEMDLTGYHSLAETTALSFTAGNPELSLSSLVSSNPDAFRPERVVRAELAFTDRGTWSGASVSYAVNDLVTGDGDPDGKFYEATEAHTSSSSNEPGTAGGDGVWALRMWKRGDRVDLYDYATIARALGDRSLFRLYLPDDFVFDTDGEARGKPQLGAFLTDTKFFAYPVPDAAYKIVFVQKQAVTAFNAGDDAVVDIDVPLPILLPAIPGMCAYLDPDHKMTPRWRAAFEQHVIRVDGETLIDAGEPVKDALAYADHTDRMDRMFGGFNG